MRAFLINPADQSITEFSHDGTFPSLLAYIPYETMTAAFINDFGDRILYCGGPESKEHKQWGVFCTKCQEVHALNGISIIYGTADGGVDSIEEPIISVRGYREMIEWMDGSHAPASIHATNQQNTGQEDFLTLLFQALAEEVQEIPSPYKSKMH